MLPASSQTFGCIKQFKTDWNRKRAKLWKRERQGHWRTHGQKIHTNEDIDRHIDTKLINKDIDRQKDRKDKEINRQKIEKHK